MTALAERNEVSERSLERDRTANFELIENELEVHRQPGGKTHVLRRILKPGQSVAARILKPGQSVSLLAFDDAQIQWWASV